MRTPRLALLLLLSLLLATLCAPTIAAEEPAATGVPSDSSSPATAEATATDVASPSNSTSPSVEWLGPFHALVRQLARLPFDSSSDDDAVRRLRSFRSAAAGQATDWTHRVSSVYIPAWEVRAFPDSLDQLRATPWFREAYLNAKYYVDEEEEEVMDDKPALMRPNLLHILAGRGFFKAAKEGPNAAKQKL